MELLKSIQEDVQRLSAEDVKVAGDPIANLLHIDDDKVILLTSVTFAVLLEVISGIGF